MANVLVDNASLSAIASSIRAKNGLSATYKPGEMAAAIGEIVPLPAIRTFQSVTGTMPSAQPWARLAFGNGKFVATAIQNRANAAYSTDGISWTAATLPSSGSWMGITYGNGKFVAVASGSNTAAYSTDGISWTAATLPSSASWFSVAYGNGRFVAVSLSNAAAYSADGITWTAATMPSSANWWEVTYGNGKFVAVGYSGTTAAYSTDGISWTAATLPSTASWISVAYGNGRFVTVASGNSNKTAYSTDGISWTAATLPGSKYWNSIAYGNGKFVAVANGTTAAYSAGGSSWLSATVSISAEWYVAYGSGRFVAVGHSTISTVIMVGSKAETGDVLEGKLFITSAGEVAAGSNPVRQLVENDQAITPTGSYATSTYYDTAYGVKVGYLSDGDILLSMQGGSSTSYEYLYFNLSSAPSGVSITEAHNTSSSYATAKAGLIYACVLHGVTEKCRVSIAMSTIDSTGDYVRCDVTITNV